MKMRRWVLIGITMIATAASADDVPPTQPPPAIEPDDCWVEVWNEKGFKEGSLRLDGPKSIPKLADLEYSNGENLNDDIEAARTGNTARLELYDNPDFGGQKYSVPEATSDAEFTGFDDSASSMKILCIDPNAPAPTIDDCWVTVFNEKGFKERSHDFKGAQAIPKLADLEYDNGENLEGDVESLKAGRAARVELFADDNYGGKRYLIFEGSEEAAFAGFDEEASSLKVTCVGIQ